MLAWRLSNTLTTDFCLEAVREAITQYGHPKIFNTDQGCQFTSLEFTSLLKNQGIQISMDGRGCWRDNVFVERLWRSLKYEEVYLHAYETVRHAQQGLERYIQFYNQLRPHRALDGRPIACAEKTDLHSLPLRRPKPPDATYELAETVQVSGATSAGSDTAMRCLSIAAGRVEARSKKQFLMEAEIR